MKWWWGWDDMMMSMSDEDDMRRGDRGKAVESKVEEEVGPVLKSGRNS